MNDYHPAHECECLTGRVDHTICRFRSEARITGTAVGAFEVGTDL